MNIRTKWSALILCICMILSCKSSSEQQTEMIAYTMSQFTRFEVYNDTEEYYSWLRKTFGISNNEIEDVMDYVKTKRTLDDLEKNAVSLILEKLKQTPNVSSVKESQNFVTNILYPYLLMVKSGNINNQELKDKVNKTFASYYKLPQDKNGLNSLISSYKEYENGGYFKNDSLEAFNLALRKSRYYFKFSLDSKYSCMFDIKRELLDERVSEKYKLSVFLLKRNIPCVLPSEHGISYNGTKAVVVFEDKLKRRSTEIYESMKNEKYIEYKNGKAERFWNKIGINVSLTDANRIMDILSKNDFKNKTEKQIEDDLIFSTAIHEAKHKYDEFNAGIRINWDNEISAHLSEIVFSNTPYSSLRDAMQRVDGFVVAGYDAKMIKTAKSLWQLAIEIDQKILNKKVFKKKHYVSTKTI